MSSDLVVSLTACTSSQVEGVSYALSSGTCHLKGQSVVNMSSYSCKYILGSVQRSLLMHVF